MRNPKIRLIDFDSYTLRDGITIIKNGTCRTSKGEVDVLDPFAKVINDDEEWNILHPPLQVEKAMFSSGFLKHTFKNIDFKKYTPREKCEFTD